MKISGEKIFNLGILLVLCLFVIMSLTFPPKAKLLPLIIGIPGIILMIVLLVSDFLKPQKEATSLTKEEKKRQYQMFLGVVALFFIIICTGISLGVALFLFAFIRFVAKRKLLVAFGMALFGFALTYGLFGVALHYPLYKGLLNLI
ncbi:tripartite tricarboxylate transporter TctB family protein [Candidatus Formimonas warabiya]|uniref:DUF1468 domain-containing protein n=1 Tax=Formimonas warabiya TaxID=1761012 RepID=A0A3G1KXD8_FORW1|nr:tripartite tricarboxylate transporter TctB family protein [Candidatus Formimonas warabiya]ATW27148.1 hypothetical protein DCMF_22515 [Candidatus Formimonas warabiya]